MTLQEVTSIMRDSGQLLTTTKAEHEKQCISQLRSWIDYLQRQIIEKNGKIDYDEQY